MLTCDASVINVAALVNNIATTGRAGETAVRVTSRALTIVATTLYVIAR